MKMATYTPIPPLPPLPPILLPGKEIYGKRTFLSAEKPNFMACKNSDKEIWKVGLAYNNQELDVVFGDLKADQLMGSIFNPKMNEQLSRSIIIPSQQSKMKKTGGENGDEIMNRILKYGGIGPFEGAFHNPKPQMPGLKNHRFKEYIKKYFPKENVIIQPMDNIMKNVISAANPIVAKKSPVTATSPYEEPERAGNYMSPQRVTLKERLIVEANILSAKPPVQLQQDNEVTTEEHISIDMKKKHTDEATQSCISQQQEQEISREGRISIGGRKFISKQEYFEMKKKQMEEAVLVSAKSNLPHQHDEAISGECRNSVAVRKCSSMSENLRKQEEQSKERSTALPIKAVAECIQEREPSSKGIKINAQSQRKVLFEFQPDYQKQVMEAFSERKQQRRQRRPELTNRTEKDNKEEEDGENNSTALEHPLKRASEVKSCCGRSESEVAGNQTSSTGKRSIIQNRNENMKTMRRLRDRSHVDDEISTVSERPPLAPSASRMFTDRKEGDTRTRATSVCVRRIVRGDSGHKLRAHQSVERVLKSEKVGKQPMCLHQHKSEKKFGPLHRSTGSSSCDTLSGRTTSYSRHSISFSRGKTASLRENRKIWAPEHDFDDICKTLRSHVIMAQTNLIYSMLSELAVVGKIGAPAKYNKYKESHHRYKTMQTLVLDTEFVKKICKTTSENCDWLLSQGAPTFVLLPRWERNFLGLRGLNSSKKVVIGCRRPTGHWMITGQ